jgi:cytochrome c553
VTILLSAFARLTATVVGLALAGSAAALAQSARNASPSSAPSDIPTWAFPTTSAPFVAVAAPFDSLTPLRVPGSVRAYTMAQVRNVFAPPDWHPETHSRMPPSVARGRAPAVWACGYCHLPDGQGRSENATLAGLPADYIIRQVADLKSRARHSVLDSWGPTANMYKVADSVTDDAVREAAWYFSRIKAKQRYKVVERAEIPLTYQIGGLYALAPAGGTEPLGRRIIEITESAERHELRDAAATFIAYVPPGSIAAGKRIATTPGGTPVRACVTCHGPDLRGVGVVPPIAGHSPSYLFRQLLAFKSGTRAASTSAPMQAVASALSLDDMIAVVAYAGSRRPSRVSVP